jgi:putative oxidoreductase
MKFLDQLEPVGLLCLRIALAIIFVYHGYPKLVHSTAEMQQFFVDHGLPGYFVYVAGVLETFGGFLLLFGLFTRPVAVLLAIEMLFAIWKVKMAPDVVFVKDYEFEMLICSACLALASVGPGMASVDYLVLKKWRGRRRGSAS